MMEVFWGVDGWWWWWFGQLEGINQDREPRANKGRAKSYVCLCRLLAAASFGVVRLLHVSVQQYLLFFIVSVKK